MEVSQKILLVDDELSNLEVISEYLEDESFEVCKATNGKEALELLNNHANNFAAIVLDRMMPVMNGMELLKIIKNDAVLSGIPVVMQSAAAQPEQVREGIEAGVFYYITKPFERSVFLAILRSSIEYSFRRIRIKEDLKHYKNAMPLMNDGYFSFNKISDLRNICTVLSSAFPKPEKAFFGLMELAVNAHEHGNLGISYEEKKQLLIKREWEKVLAEKELLPENAKKFVSVEFHNKPNYFELIIKDQGKGFSPEKYLDFDEKRILDPNGRGIAMSRKFSFDEVIFSENGTRVSAKIKKDKF